MRFVVRLCAWGLVVAQTSAGAVQAARPVLTLDPGPSGTEIRVDARLLRTTSAPVDVGPTGGDPSGRALFARWTEAGTPWASYSRDAGGSWSEPRPLDLAIRLLDGAALPGHSMPSVSERFRFEGDPDLWIVQFRAFSLPEWREALSSSGATILGYFPQNAHIVRLPAPLISAVRALDFVERVEPFQPGYRVESEIRRWIDGRPLAAAVRDEGGRVRLNVVALERGPEPKDRIAAAAAALGATVALKVPSGSIVELWAPRDAIPAIAAFPDVAWIDRWSEPENDMDIARVDSGANAVESSDGWCGSGVRGEVMDAGIQENHPDFDGIVLHTAVSLDSHGTSTYGIVFGNGDRDGDGQARGTGFMPCSGAQGIFADYGVVGDRFAHTQELKAAPYLAAFQSNSWGNSLTTQYNSVSSQMDDIIFRLDIAITQSQSNNGNQSSRPQAWAKNIISVGGIRHRDTLTESDDAWAGGASIGPAADGRIKPDVHYWYDSIYTTTTGSSYTSGFGGTSAATPMVAGVLGLMMEMWADDVWGTHPQGATVFEKLPHHTTIKALLVNNAKQYSFTGTTSDLTRTHQGWGRPNVEIAKARASRSFVVDWDQPLAMGERAAWDVRVAADESELKVTMIYPDPPGTISSTLHRINDVNLKVTSPGGTVYHGNFGLDAGHESIPGGSPNTVDTVENVFVQAPESGLWRVEIEAAEVNADGYLDTPQDDVVFSLVVTGATGGGECGNGVREAGEQCDGGDVAGLTCADLGCDGGTLGCTAECRFETATCVACPTCGDGTCDLGETCATCAADCVSASVASCGNGTCETGDGEDCVSCPSDCNGVQGGKPANRYCCGDGDGQSPVGCNDSRCSAGGLSCRESVVYAYCCGDRACEGVESESLCAVDCAPPRPGEAGTASSGGPLLLGYDRGADEISVSFGPACGAGDHAIVYGRLDPADVASYAWSGRECGVGSSGTYTWRQAGLPDSLFFVVVGTTITEEGSYGRDGNDGERPEDTAPSACQVPRVLYLSCN